MTLTMVVSGITNQHSTLEHVCALQYKPEVEEKHAIRQNVIKYLSREEDDG